ncbi:hypothetical protein LT493_36400 [Streptomyces tricolor]|nr:hypothetical protein [Streptomyces tricolor]
MTVPDVPGDEADTAPADSFAATPGPADPALTSSTPRAVRASPRASSSSTATSPPRPGPASWSTRASPSSCCCRRSPSTRRSPGSGEPSRRAAAWSWRRRPTCATPPGWSPSPPATG